MAYTNLIVINPLVMYKEDLLEQKKLLRELLADDGSNYTFYAMDKGNPLSATPFKSVDDILKADFPKSVDQISIEARQMSADGKLIEKNISLLLDKKMADIRIYSDADKDWVKNSAKVLGDFYETKKTWFAGIKRGMAPLSNVTMVASLYIGSMNWTSKHYLLTSLPALLVLYSFTMLTLSLKGKIFPYSQLHLISKEELKRPNYELNFLIGWVLLFIATAAGLIHVLYF